MKKLNYAILAILLVAPIANSKDLQVGDPLRKQVISDLKSSKAYSDMSAAKLHIKRIWASEQYAFVCTLVEEGGQYWRTDESVEQYQIVLKRAGTRWVPIAEVGPAFTDPNQVVCMADRNGALSDRYLVEIAKQGREIK